MFTTFIASHRLVRCARPHYRDVDFLKNVMTLLSSSTGHLCKVSTKPKYSLSSGAPGRVYTRLCLKAPRRAELDDHRGAAKNSVKMAR